MDESENACLLNETQPVVGPKHRIDIQWLRAIAIISVLVFHLDSNLLKNGYLGVDMFFVISGYLMSCILNYSSKKELSLELLKTFYIRRIKRIIPVYLLTVLLTLVICSFRLLEYDFDKLRIDTIWSITFTTNIQSIINHDNYFVNIYNFKFLLHTWSLSVEIQYYLISPFLLCLIYKSGKPLHVTMLFIVASFLFQMMALNNEPLSFGFLFSRIWQFMVGTFVYYIDKNFDNNARSDTPKRTGIFGVDNKIDNQFYNSQISIYFILLSSLIAMLLLPDIPLNWKPIIRLVITVFTGLLIYFGNVIESKNIPLKLLAFIGDISYSIYLVHWPIIVLIKYHLVYQYEGIWLYVIAMLIYSVLQYKFVEKVVSSLSSVYVVFSIIALLYTLIITLLIAPQGFGLKNDKNMSPHIKINQQLLRQCNEEIFELRHNVADFKAYSKEFHDSAIPIYSVYDGNGTGIVLVVGNSFVNKHVFQLKKKTNNTYHKLYVVSQPGCTVFSEFNHVEWKCSFMNSLVKIMENLKPDVMIVIQRLSLEKTMNSELYRYEDAKNDTVTQKMRKYWDVYSQLTKQILIVEPHATFVNKPISSMTKLLRENQNLDDYYISEDEWDKEINPGWWRIQASIDKCEICSTVSIKKRFCHEDKKCDIYDRETKSMLFCDSAHFSNEGSARVAKGIVDKISRKLVH